MSTPGADQRGTDRPDDPRLPWTGRPRRADIACWAGITLSGLYYMALLPFRPELVGTHPLLLELLGGGSESIVAGAAFARVGRVSLAMVLLAAVPGMMKFDPLFWWAGRLWGPRMIALVSGRSGRGLRLANRVPRWGRAFTWPAVVLAPFVPFPGMVIYIIAGWAGMRLVTFIVLDLIGTLMWAGSLAGLGYAMGQRAVDIAQAVSHYGLWISLALVAVIIAGQVRSGRRARRSADATAVAGTAGTPGPVAPPPGILPLAAPAQGNADGRSDRGGPPGTTA